ncbi:MAG: hypothetical protein DCF12_22515 [Snowella sp.]|nr:MAG: hypothetical protein DCF12_22515 [Snowella sp.]
MIARNKKTNRPEINSHCFRSIVEKLKWKNSDNHNHYKNKDPIIHYYSDSAIEEFIDKIMSIEGYLEDARKGKSTNSKKKRSD